MSKDAFHLGEYDEDEVDIDFESGGNLEEVESAKSALVDLKFGILVTVCRAPEEAVSRDDLFLAWGLLDDPALKDRLADEGLLEEAESCKRMGSSHWYLQRMRIGALIDGDFLIMVGLVDDMGMKEDWLEDVSEVIEP